MLSFPQIRQIEERRQSRAILLGASNLEMNLLPELYEILRETGPAERLDVVVYCRGGYVNAARRLALLFHDFTEHLSFLVPHYCESAATIMSLGAHEIIAGPLAVFSPIDPLLAASGSTAEGEPMAVSSQDVRLFTQMGQDWFGLKESEDQVRSLSVLCENIFPTTLTSFYRSTLELKDIGEELLGLHMANAAPELRSQIVDRLLFGYHSHNYAITRQQMKELGLPVAKDHTLEELAWEIARDLGPRLGGGARKSAEEDWIDVVLATRGTTRVRRRSPASPAPEWQSLEA